MPSEASTKPPSIWSRTFIVLCCVNLFQVMGQMMMMTIMPLYARELGASATIIGFIVGSFAITALVIRPFASPAFDSFPKKPIFLVGVFVMALSCFLYGFATSVPVLIGVRMLHGCAMGCTGPLALSLVTEALPLSRVASGISIYSLAQALSQAVGPACGLYLIEAIGFQWTFRLSGCLLLVACALITLVREKPRNDRPPYKLALNRSFAKDAVIPAILSCIVSSANTAIMSFIAIYAGLRGVDNIGIYFTVQACCLLATRPLFGKLADRVGPTTVIIPALGVYAAAFVIISQATELWMFLLAAVVCSCGFGVCAPLMQALAMACVPRVRSGAASSTNFTGIDIAMLAGPATAGWLVETYTQATGSEVAGYSSMYLTIIAIVAVALVFLLITRPIIQHNIKTAEAENLRNEAREAVAAPAD